jgi:hypothetical protein
VSFHMKHGIWLRGGERGLFWSRPCVKTSKCGREKEMLQQENKEEEKRSLGV